MAFDPVSDPVDFIVLSGVRSPGICELEKASSPRRWDERRGFGLSGATTIFRGVALSHFVAKFRLYSAEDWAGWSTFSTMLARPPVGERPRALEIVHPILEDLGISAVGVEELKQPIQTGHGEWTVEVLFIEYRKLAPALSAPDGAAAAVTDPIDREIERLAGQVAALAGVTP